MQASKITVSVLVLLLAVSCTTTKLQKFGELEKTTDESRLYISFDAPGVDYRRSVSRINRSAIGWIETGTWRATGEAGESQVEIYLAALYDGKAFGKDSVLDMRTLARRVSSSGSPSFGEQGELNTESGTIEFLFFRQDAATCVLVRKYWSDPKLASDLIQLTSSFEWVAGQSVIYATDCRPGREELRMNDLNRLFNGIEARNVYSPDSMFRTSDRRMSGTGE